MNDKSKEKLIEERLKRIKKHRQKTIIAMAKRAALTVALTGFSAVSNIFNSNVSESKAQVTDKNDPFADFVQKFNNPDSFTLLSGTNETMDKELSELDAKELKKAFGPVFDIDKANPFKYELIKDQSGKIAKATIKYNINTKVAKLAQEREMTVYGCFDIGGYSYFTKDGINTKDLIGQPVSQDKIDISSGFSAKRTVMDVTRPHDGIDYRLPVGTDLVAVADGVVEEIAYNENGYGHYITFNHGENEKHQKITTTYGHLKKIGKDLKVGDKVEKGQIIAQSGNTGRSTGAHLHFEVRADGKPLDPFAKQIGLGSIKDNTTFAHVVEGSDKVMSELAGTYHFDNFVAKVDEDAVKSKTAAAKSRISAKKKTTTTPPKLAQAKAIAQSRSNSNG